MILTIQKLHHFQVLYDITLQRYAVRYHKSSIGEQ